MRSESPSNQFPEHIHPARSAFYRTRHLQKGLNRFAVCSGSRFREQPGFQSSPSLLPPERLCEEKGMLSATQTHLAKELSNDTASTTHD